MEVSPVPAAVLARVAAAQTKKDATDLTADSNSEFDSVPAVVPTPVAAAPTKKDLVDLTKDRNSELDSESDSSDEASVFWLMDQ